LRAGSRTQGGHQIDRQARARIVSVGPNIDWLTAARIEWLRAVAFVAGCAFMFWQYDGAPVDWLFALGIAASVALMFRGGRAFDLSWPNALIVVFIVITILATLLAHGSSVALAITIYLVVAALAFAAAVDDDARLRRLASAAIIVAGLLTVATVGLGWVARHTGWEQFYWLTYDAFRSRGLFKDPNVAGGFLACTYPLAAAFAARRGRLALPLLLVATALFGTGVLLTFSRMALVVFALGFVGVVAALAWQRSWRLFASFLAATAIAGAVVGAVAVQRVGLDALPLWRYQLQAYDDQGRFVVWGFAAQMFRDAPLGTGAGSFEPRALVYFNGAEDQKISGQDLTVTPSAHNTYLRVLVESGLIGIVSFLAFLAILLWRGIRNMTPGSWEWPLAFALVLVAGLAIDTLHWRELWVLAAIVGGTMVARERLTARTPPPAT
jgi:O-antigen ligase